MLAAVIQARMGSTRLPGKTLREIAGKSMLSHVVDRTSTSKFIEGVVIATTVEARDDSLAEFAQQRGLPCYRGNEHDVLDRTYQAALRFGVTTIVRVTPDCPLLDPRVLDRVIEVFRSGDYDYVANAAPRTYPDGLDVEVFSFAALERAWREARRPSEREHVTPYLRMSGAFRTCNVEHAADLSHLKWSVDTPEDLEFARAIFAALDGQGVFSMEDVLRALREFPALAATNARSVVNEGYYRSLVDDPAPPVTARRLTESGRLKARADTVIPGCSQTFSKAPSQFVQGVAPVFLARGDGCRVWDVDGNEYIDYGMGLGAVILGYGDPGVTRAVERHAREGAILSLPHPLEVEVAERLVELFPCAEMARFGKNGSDATSGAVRLARAYTGRDVVACAGYHGWQDWFIGTTTRARGVPAAVRELTVPFRYNDVESLTRVFAEHPGGVAAVILEPVGVEEPRDGFLEAVRAVTRREGAVLIFDEILTGFRLARGGAQEYFGVVPDLACVGKSMGNGYPISAVVGPRELMRLFEEVFFSFTFGGDMVSLAAARATIERITETNVVGQLWSRGRQLMDGYNVLARELGVSHLTRCMGLAPRTVFTFHDEGGQESLLLKSIFQQECIKRGVLLSAGQNLAVAHGDREVDQTLRVYRAALEVLAMAVASGEPGRWLEGTPVQPVFRQP
jgi:glutamate-1-semialdehyde aminotransferase/spore coat polysaccharide biosynthesis protein SpsF (cytidylyltransferase family)